MTSAIGDAALEAASADDGLEITEQNRNVKIEPDLALQRAESLVLRLWRVTNLLGLGQIVPEGWAAPTIEGVSFTPLTLRQANRLVFALEDLAIGQRPSSVGPGRGQFTLFEGGF